jgi:Ser/Thr protein kinase RdoA (MazF antagonist)
VPVPGPQITDRVDAAGLAEVARLAAGRYGIGPGCRLHLYPLTENWTFRIDSGHADPAVLRIYRPGGRSPAEIHSELAWMEALRQDSPAVLPGVLPTLGGAQVLEVVREPPLASCYCVLFSHAPGSEPAEDELAAWFPRLGEITGRLHRHARAWTVPAWFRRPRWDLATTLGDRPHWGSWQTSVTDPEERRQTQRLADVVTSRLRSFGDGPELIALWADGYRQVEPLSAEDEVEIGTFVMLRRLMLSAYAGLRADTELAAQMKANGYSAQTCRIAEPYLSRFG